LHKPEPPSSGQEAKMYVLHIERKNGSQKYRFKLQVPSLSRQDALAQFNVVADRYQGETKLISCRRLSEDLDPDDPDAIE